jgi:hypothetical protein
MAPDNQWWVYLLKQPMQHNFTVVGFGVASFTLSPQFQHKFLPELMCLDNEDLDDDVVAYFASMFPDHESIKPAIRETLALILTYTGGHTHPFLKLSEYMLTKYKSNSTLTFSESSFKELVCNEDFYTSEIGSDIVNRSYRMSDEIVESAYNIFSSGLKYSASDRFESENPKYGKGKKYVILNLVLDKDQPPNIPVKYESKKDNFYSFVKRHNALYNGNGQVVKQGVSNFLKDPLARPFSTYSRYYSLLILVLGRFPV